MMKCKTRVEPFDVLIKNRMTIMTSADRANQLVDECQVKRRKGWPTTDKNHQQKNNCCPEKQFNRRKTAILKSSSLQESLKLLQFIRWLFKSPASIIL